MCCVMHNLDHSLCHLLFAICFNLKLVSCSALLQIVNFCYFTLSMTGDLTLLNCVDGDVVLFWFQMVIWCYFNCEWWFGVPLHWLWTAIGWYSVNGDWVILCAVIVSSDWALLWLWNGEWDFQCYSVNRVSLLRWFWINIRCCFTLILNGVSVMIFSLNWSFWGCASAHEI